MGKIFIENVYQPNAIDYWNEGEEHCQTHDEKGTSQNKVNGYSCCYSFTPGGYVASTKLEWKDLFFSYSSDALVRSGVIGLVLSKTKQITLETV